MFCICTYHFACSNNGMQGAAAVLVHIIYLLHIPDIYLCHESGIQNQLLLDSGRNNHEGRALGGPGVIESRC